LVEIRPLTPAELDDFLGFMEGPAFETNPQWAGCYCQFYLNKPEDQPSAAERFQVNRKTACDRIDTKKMNGYLAYEGTEVIGWVAANKANNFVALPPTGEDVARVLCFIVSAEHQGKGVATQLLKYAIADLQSKGFKSIEAAPVAADEFAAWGYRGKLSTFLKAGFEAGPMIDEKHILVHMNFTA
jgi:ribosomal protein S18 acetylase RimI-like enzyme